MTWTVADIDAAIPIAQAKRDAATAKGDLEAAANHQSWIDRLLDARPHHDLAHVGAVKTRGVHGDVTRTVYKTEENQ